MPLWVHLPEGRVEQQAGEQNLVLDGRTTLTQGMSPAAVALLLPVRVLFLATAPGNVDQNTLSLRPPPFLWDPT